MQTRNVVGYLDVRNRDEVKPIFPLKEDRRLKTYKILKAHEILRKGLQQFLEFRDEDLGFYLNHIINNKPNKYGQEIRCNLKVVVCNFSFNTNMATRHFNYY